MTHSTRTLGSQLYLSFGAALLTSLLMGAVAFASLGRLDGSNAGSNAGASHTAYVLMTLLMLAALLVAAAACFLVRRITADLSRMAAALHQGAQQIAAAASQVAASSQALAQGASEQAAAIEETSASTEEINSMARRNTENSSSTAVMVSDSSLRFEATDRSLHEMVEAMDGINTASEQISRIIKVIDQIAFQTNILALNAAVEAARAGDAGMGFAVVADEVRSLAQRSAQAAKDTAELIEDSIVKSQAGKRKVDQVAADIRSITAESSKMKLLVDEINLGSQEQSRGIDQVSKSIHQMEQVTQSNAASAEQSAAAAEQLTAQSHSVRDIVEHLAALVGEINRPVTGAPARRDKHPGRAATATAATALRAGSVLRTRVSHGAGKLRTSLKVTTTAASRPATGRITSPAFDKSSFPLDESEFKAF